MNELRLTPRRITLDSNLKLFGLGQGRSVGSGLTIEFDVPAAPNGETDPAWTQHQIWREKERLDVMVATMELASGGFTRSEYDEWRLTHRKFYDELLKRKPKE